MNVTGEIKDCSLDIKSGKPKITLEINEKSDFLAEYDELKDKNLSIEIKQYHPKRSLNANAYFWVLCGKLAAKTKISKVEIYREFIKNIGDNFEILAVKTESVETFCRNWERGRLGWFCENLGSRINGYTNLCAYYGSSSYDSKQMSDLIEAAKVECEEQGIQTLPPDEVARLIDLWGKTNK